MSRERMVIIDGNSLINRAFYALPPLVTKEGQYTNAIYGFTAMLLKVIDEYHPQYLGVAFDLKGPTFRHQEFEGYKAGRKGMPEELRQQVQPLKELLDALNVYRIELQGYEADDLIGTVSKFCEAREIETLIVTGDRDALQLVSDKVKVLFTKKGISSLEIYDPAKIMEDYEVTPLQFIDLKALMGDKSDNIPGVPGVGEKTAIKLIKEFGSVESLIQRTGEVAADKLRQKLEDHVADMVMSKRLATIVTELPVEIQLEPMAYQAPNAEALLPLLKSFEFNSLIQRFSIQKQETIEPEGKAGAVRVLAGLQDLKGAVAELEKAPVLAVKTLTADQEEGQKQALFALGLSAGPDQAYVYYFEKESLEESLALLRPLLESTVPKAAHDMKKELLHFKAQGIEMQAIAFDTMIAAYLLDASRSSYDLKGLAEQYLNKSLEDEEGLLGKGKSKQSFSALPREQTSAFLSQQAKAVVALIPLLQEKLEELELVPLFEQVELPLAQVLASMECEGIQVDRHILEELGVEFSEQIDQLTEEIYRLAGTTFNINSPKQLGEILFEKLGLPPLKKTKTGFSTNAEVLEKLQSKHDIIPYLLAYRQITKLKSTYVDGLLGIINSVTGRIHSNFNQTVTTTGRISSTEPNLQNIPVKQEVGRRLRRVFVAKPGWQFIDADYSQIELRVLAHISQDQNLLDAFNRNQDIHTRTASEIFGVPMDQVTSAMRSSAKAVNFGIVYGISDFGLGENLKISRFEAKKYIDSYLDKYAAVKAYMKGTVEQAKEKGYVLTMLKRRRYLPELHSGNFNIRSFGERIAMNTPIQGSAADIIKIAMVEVYRRLQEGNWQSKLILQVHDELIVEAPEAEAAQVAEIVREAMEGAIALAIPLKVDLSVASNWYDAK